VAVRGIDALPLLVQLEASRAAVLIGSILQQDHTCADSHSASAGRGAGTPVAPLGGGAVRIRQLHLLELALRPHALVLLHHGDVGASLASQVVDKGARPHGDPDAAAGRAL